MEKIHNGIEDTVVHKPLVSIVVPVYNVEKYLKRCVYSLVNQTYPLVEIVLVDDGSIDNSGIICDELAVKYTNLKVFHKKNGGLSSARNYGIDRCKGEFIAFVDSDDWIERNFTETLVTYMLVYDADVVCCNINIVNNSHVLRSWQSVSDKIEVFDNLNLMRVLANDYISTSSCNKMFKRRLINDERYTEGILYEDVEFMHRCLSHANSGVFLHTPLYNYFVNDEGITRTKFSHKSFDFVEASEQRLDFYNQNYPSLNNELINRHLEICFNTLERSVFRREYKTKRNNVRKKILLYINAINAKHVLKKYRIKADILRMGLYVFDSFVWIYQKIRILCRRK